MRASCVVVVGRVVVGRASSSSLYVRSTSFMLLFKLLVILWNENKH